VRVGEKCLVSCSDRPSAFQDDENQSIATYRNNPLLGAAKTSFCRTKKRKRSGRLRREVRRDSWTISIVVAAPILPDVISSSFELRTYVSSLSGNILAAFLGSVHAQGEKVKKASSPARFASPCARSSVGSLLILAGGKPAGRSRHYELSSSACTSASLAAACRRHWPLQRTGGCPTRGRRPFSRRLLLPSSLLLSLVRSSGRSSPSPSTPLDEQSPRPCCAALSCMAAMVIMDRGNPKPKGGRLLAAGGVVDFFFRSLARPKMRESRTAPWTGLETIPATDG
jgi:hypothetical protein